MRFSMQYTAHYDIFPLNTPAKSEQIFELCSYINWVLYVVFLFFGHMCFCWFIGRECRASRSRKVRKIMGRGRQIKLYGSYGSAYIIVFMLFRLMIGNCWDDSQFAYFRSGHILACNKLMLMILMCELSSIGIDLHKLWSFYKMAEMMKRSPFDEPKITAVKWSITSFRLFLAFSPLRSSLRNVSSKKQSKITSILIVISIVQYGLLKRINELYNFFLSSYINCSHRQTQTHNEKKNT